MKDFLPVFLEILRFAQNDIGWIRYEFKIQDLTPTCGYHFYFCLNEQRKKWDVVLTHPIAWNKMVVGGTKWGSGNNARCSLLFHKAIFSTFT
jgi:hypothetical protein